MIHMLRMLLYPGDHRITPMLCERSVCYFESGGWDISVCLLSSKLSKRFDKSVQEVSTDHEDTNVVLCLEMQRKYCVGNSSTPRDSDWDSDSDSF